MSNDTGGLDIYIKELKRLPPLSASEQNELAVRARQGDSDAREKFISHNLRYAFSVAKTYRSSGVPLPDIIQAGNLGLTIAAGRFDPSRGFRFISFAVHYIRQQIRLCIAQQRTDIRVPIGVRGLQAKIERFCEGFVEEFGRSPSDVEVSKAVSVSIETVRRLQFVGAPMSLDEVLGSEGSVCAHELVPDEAMLNPEELCIHQEERDLLLRRRQEVLDILASLPVRKLNREMHERNIQMFIAYTGLDGSSSYPTLKELGETHGITREAVRQKLERLFERVQTRIGRADGKPFNAGTRVRREWRGNGGSELLD